MRREVFSEERIFWTKERTVVATPESSIEQTVLDAIARLLEPPWELRLRGFSRDQSTAASLTPHAPQKRAPKGNTSPHAWQPGDRASSAGSRPRASTGRPHWPQNRAASPEGAPHAQVPVAVTGRRVSAS